MSKTLRNIIFFIILYMFITFAIITYKYLTASDSSPTSVPTTPSPTTPSPTTPYPTTQAPVPTTQAPVPTTQAPVPTLKPSLARTIVDVSITDITKKKSDGSFFYLTNYDTQKRQSTKYGIVKGVKDDLKYGAWWSKQWKILPPWADDNDTENILVRIFSHGQSYSFNNPEINDPLYGCRWITDSHMNGSGPNQSGIGDDFMLKRVYQDLNRNWITYDDGNIIVKSDGTITI